MKCVHKWSKKRSLEVYCTTIQGSQIRQGSLATSYEQVAFFRLKQEIYYKLLQLGVFCESPFGTTVFILQAWQMCWWEKFSISLNRAKVICWILIALDHWILWLNNPTFLHPSLLSCLLVTCHHCFVFSCINSTDNWWAEWREMSSRSVSHHPYAHINACVWKHCFIAAN